MVLIKEILDRIKNHTGTNKDSDIARILNVEPQNVFNWKKRGTIPWEELCTFALEQNISFDWLLTGKQQDKFMCGWPDEVIKACNELKEILDFGEKDEKEDVLRAIRQAKKINDLKKYSADLSSATPQKGFGKKKAM